MIRILRLIAVIGVVGPSVLGMQPAGAIVDPSGGGAHLPQSHRCSSTSHYTFSQRCSSWFVYAPYSVDVEPGLSDYAAQIDDAAQAWYNTPTWLDPYRVADPSQARIHIHVVSATHDSVWGDTWWSQTNGIITQDDIWLYAPTIDANWNGDGSLAGVIAHEFGHAFGLNHPNDCAPSIMVPGGVGCATYSTPQPTDIDDIRTLYP